jgi:hypothetical protein
MNILIKKQVKRDYISPRIDCIKLDIEISLALTSAPGDPESLHMQNAPEYFNNDPFKTNVG